MPIVHRSRTGKTYHLHTGPKRGGGVQHFFSTKPHGTLAAIPLLPFSTVTWLPIARADVALSDMTTVNPFPGMNPYFEQGCRDAHTMLIGYLRDALQERLPADLIARAEKEAVSMRGGQGTINYRPDVQVREPWTFKEPAAAA